MEVNRMEYKINFDTNKLLKCIHHISEVSNVVTAIYHSTKDFNPDTLNPLETDGLGLIFPNENGTVALTSDMIKEWAFRKGFEDIIVGSTQTLIEAYKLLQYHSMVRESTLVPFAGIEGIENKLAEVSGKADRLHFPVLIEEIERELNLQLPYKEEILSVNRARNCFVHRNAVVSKKDIASENEYLSLFYTDLRMFIKNGDQITELTKEVKANNPYAEDIIAENTTRQVNFNLNEKIKLNPDIFKGVTYTCILFIQNLILKLPLSDEIKQQLVFPFNFKMVFNNPR